MIDFYHVCEYLSEAAKTIAPEPAACEAWMEARKEALKTGRLDEVLRALAPHCEPPGTSDDQAPVRTCHRYLSGRRNQLKYREALAEGLPIGSGEIESAHRYVAQKRLKLPGCRRRCESAANRRRALADGVAASVPAGVAGDGGDLGACCVAVCQRVCGRLRQICGRLRRRCGSERRLIAVRFAGLQAPGSEPLFLLP